MTLYDIHGYVVSVEGPADEAFSEEYGWARVHSTKEASLYVRLSKKNERLPTRPAGSPHGMYLPFEDDERTIWYEKGIPLNVLLRFCEALFHWPNKALVHAGAVVKNGKASIFVGPGNVGKTSIVLNLVRVGYEYLSDDWLLIDENQAYPMPKLIHVFDYNLKNKEIAKSVLGSRRFLYRPVFPLVDFCRKHSPHRFLRYGFEVLKPMFVTDLRRINPNARVADPSSIYKVFYLERKVEKEIVVTKEIEAKELARRMAYVSLFEWNFLLREYYRYVSLYGTKSEKVERKFEHDSKIIGKAFEKANLFKITIPENLDLTKTELISILDLNAM